MVYFGDHLPNLGDNYYSYKELGLDVRNDTTPEQVINTYSTPYMIWANTPAAEGLNFTEKAQTLDLPENGRINANYLSAVLMEVLGHEGQDQYIDFLNDLRRDIPVFWKGNYQTFDAGYTTELTTDQAERIDMFHKWQYYKIKLEKVAN